MSIFSHNLYNHCILMTDLFPVIARPTVPPPLGETPSELLNPHYKIHIIIILKVILSSHLTTELGVS